MTRKAKFRLQLPDWDTGGCYAERDPQIDLKTSDWGRGPITCIGRDFRILYNVRVDNWKTTRRGKNLLRTHLKRRQASKKVEFKKYITFIQGQIPISFWGGNVERNNNKLILGCYGIFGASLPPQDIICWFFIIKNRWHNWAVQHPERALNEIKTI